MVVITGVCRADNGCGYVGFTTGASLDQPEVRVSLTDGSKVDLPFCLVELDLPSSRAALLPPDPTDRAWAVQFPLMQRAVTVTVGDAEEHQSLSFSSMESKVRSRLLSHRNPALADALRHSEDTCWTGRTRLLLSGVWPADDGVILRWQAIYASRNGGAVPQLTAMDTMGNGCQLSPIVMEDHVVPSERDELLSERIVTFSCKVAEEPRDLVFVTRLDGVRQSEGFATLAGGHMIGLLNESRGRIAGAVGDPAYEHWLDCHRSSWRDLHLQRSASAEVLAKLPSMTVLLYVREEALRKNLAQVVSVVKSIQAQTMPAVQKLIVGPEEALDSLEHELPSTDGLTLERSKDGEKASIGAVIESARGSYTLLCRCDASLEPDACWRFAEAIAGSAAESAQGKTPALLYADSDQFLDGHFCNPSFKTFPNLGKLRSMDYFEPVVAVKKGVPSLVGWPSADVGALLYDLELRVMERALPVTHVPRVLSHELSRREDQVWTQHRCALEQHLERSKAVASVEEGPMPGTFRIHYALSEPLPLVSVIIPNKDHADLLSKCVGSILDRTTYANYEIVIVENNSTEDATFQLYQQLQGQSPRVKVVRWEPQGKPENGFNYSAIVNAGARTAGGSLLLFLNNDTEVIAPEWVDELVGCFSRPEVGVAGAKLLYQDGLIQHAGMTVNPNCDNAHFNQNLSAHAWGFECSAALPSDVNMVTGACQMTRKDVFEQLGGYDEQLAVGFNDGDFCLRAREAGYAVAFTPYALLYHREFSSRGREALDIRLKSRLLQEKAYVIAAHPDFYAKGDDTINANLDHFSNYFSLRW